MTDDTELPPDPPSDREAAVAGRLALLDDLAKIGVGLAQELQSLAGAQARLAEAVTGRLRCSRPEGVAALGELAVLLHQGNVDFALMYERVCRSVRRCIALGQHLTTERRARTRAASGVRNAAGATRASASAEAGNTSKRESESPTGAETGVWTELTRELGAERLDSDLREPLEDLTGMADLGLDRPMAELITEICADFGVDRRLWAERLGIGDEIMAAPAPAAGEKRSGSGQGCPDWVGHAEASPNAVPHQPFAGPPSIVAAADGKEPRPTDRLIAADPGGPRALNRRERRAARKLGRKLSQSATGRHPESGCGPP
jgi:hypothetical protein